MPSHVTLSSNRHDWRTPDWFLDLVRQVGPIALDPAGDASNATQAARYFAREASSDPAYAGSCGLLGSWDREGLAFINPPYGAHLSGPVEPSYEIYRGGKPIGRGRGWAERIAQDDGEWIALVPSRTETVWWQRLHSKCVCGVFWRSPEFGSRISFVDPSTGEPKQGSNLASTVFYHGSNDYKFQSVFGEHGRFFPGEYYWEPVGN